MTKTIAIDMYSNGSLSNDLHNNIDVEGIGDHTQSVSRQFSTDGDATLQDNRITLNINIYVNLNPGEMVLDYGNGIDSYKEGVGFISAGYRLSLYPVKGFEGDFNTDNLDHFDESFYEDMFTTNLVPNTTPKTSTYYAGKKEVSIVDWLGSCVVYPGYYQQVSSEWQQNEPYNPINLGLNSSSWINKAFNKHNEPLNVPVISRSGHSFVSSFTYELPADGISKNGNNISLYLWDTWSFLMLYNTKKDFNSYTRTLSEIYIREIDLSGLL